MPSVSQGLHGWFCNVVSALFTHQSNNQTACPLSRRASMVGFATLSPHCSHIKAVTRLHALCLAGPPWLVLQRCMLLTASDFYQSRLQTNGVTGRHSDRPARVPNWCSHYSHYALVAAVYLTLVLSLTLPDHERPGNCL